MSSSDIVTSFRIPFPVFEKGKRGKKKSVRLVTMNNVLEWKRFRETKIKAEFKQLLKEYYLEEPDKTYESIHVNYRIVRHNKRKVDPDAAAFAMKWFIDILEELNYIEDDRYVTMCSYPTTTHTSPETFLEIRIKSGSSKW